MKEYLIVDGYNIIGAWPELQALKETNLEDARDRLIEILTVYAALSKRRIILVFDAYMVKRNPGSQEMVQGIEVIYTKENVTADMAIERLCAQIPKHIKVFVATSDRLQQETIWGKGAFRISAMELRREIKSTEKEHKPHYEQKVYVSNRLEDHIDPEVRKKLEQLAKEEPTKKKAVSKEPVKKKTTTEAEETQKSAKQNLKPKSKSKPKPKQNQKTVNQKNVQKKPKKKVNRDKGK